MIQDFLQRNQDKTEIIVIGGKAERDKLSDHLKLFALNTKELVKNLGVIIDCHIGKCPSII